MYTTNVFYSHRKQKTGLKWAIQLITQIWKIVYFQWPHFSKLRHAGGALDDHTKELILDAEIIEEHKQGQYNLPYHYNP